MSHQLLRCASRPLLCRLLLPGLVALGMTASAQSAVESAVNDIQLVAVQLTLNLDNYWTEEAFEASIRARMAEVSAQLDPAVPALVTFPEDVGLMLVVQGMQDRLAGLTSIEEAIGRAVRSNVVPLAWTSLVRRQSWVPALFLHRHRDIASTYFAVFSQAAREHGVWLVAGSVILPPYEIQDGVVLWEQGPLEHRVYNSSYLFAPDGSVVGRQDKVELIELEAEAALNLTPGSVEQLQVFDTAVGRIGIAICLDAFSEEVVGQLTAQGAQILVQPSANPAPWSQWQQEDWLRSAQARTAVQGHFSYAVNTMLNGPLWDVDFYGQSAIFAADGAAGGGYSLTGPAPGFLAVAAHEASQEVLAVTVPHPEVLR